MRRYGAGTTHIRARVGESFVLELPVRATSGYAWQVVRAPDVAALMDARIRPAGSARGAASVQEFEFAATREGESALVMACKRPWEATVSEQLELNVVVGD